MFFLLLLPLGVDGDLQRPPLLWTTSSSSTTPPPATTQPHPPTLSPRVSWSLRNYTANITGPSTPTPGDKSLLSVSINYSFKGHFTQVILGGFTSSLPFVSKSSNDSTTKKIASGEVYTNYLTVPPTSDEKVKQNSESGENSRIVLNSGGYLTTSEPPDVTTRRTVDQSTEQLKLSSGYVGTNNSSSVCLFEDTKLRVFDVVVYLTVDLVFSVLALFLGGTLLLVWYRTKGGRLTNRSRLEGAWHLTYCTCCCVILAASFIFWSGAKVSFPLDLLLLCAHLLRSKAAQLLLTKNLLSWKRLSCVAGTLLFLIDIAWLSLMFSLTGIIIEGCRFCQRSLLSHNCLANNVLNFVGLCGGTVLYSGFKAVCLFAQKASNHSQKLYSQIPKNSSHSVNHSIEGVVNDKLTIQSKAKWFRDSLSRASLIILTCHQVLSCLFIFGIFLSEF